MAVITNLRLQNGSPQKKLNKQDTACSQSRYVDFVTFGQRQASCFPVSSIYAKLG